MEHPEKSDGALQLYLRRNAVTEITDSSAFFWDCYEQRGLYACRLLKK
jgi:hypothetical protein